MVQQRVVELRSVKDNPPEFLRRLDLLTVRELSELFPALAPGYAGAEQQTFRDTVQAVIYRKLTESLVESITRLDTSTASLAKVGWWLTIVVGLVGILVSVVVALR
ncbi:MAG: hypothetical protein HY647_07085 [Acidobacteria bacterium]|nr:hypothetical protein [Acidobacteriota bacterium]